MFNKQEDELCPICDAKLLNNEDMFIGFEHEIHRFKVISKCPSEFSYKFDDIDCASDAHWYKLVGICDEVIIIDNKIIHVYYEDLKMTFWNLNTSFKLDPKKSRKENLNKLLIYMVFK